MDLNATQVEIAIDCLALEGFDGIDEAAVRNAFEAGLERLVAERGAPIAGEPLRQSIDVSLDWNAHTGGAALGNALAVKVYEGLSR